MAGLWPARQSNSRCQNRVNYDYGLAGYDRPNIFTFHFLYDVPRLSRLVPNGIVRAVFDGWQISDITSFISGAPSTISITTSPTALLGGGDPLRTLMMGNPNGPKTFDQWPQLSKGLFDGCLSGAHPREHWRRAANAHPWTGSQQLEHVFVQELRC